MISLSVFCFFFICFPDIQWKLRSEHSRKTDLVQCICCQILALCCWVQTWWSMFTSGSLWHTQKQRFEYCRNCSVFKEYSFLPSRVTLLHIIEKIVFPFATTSALEPLSFSFFLKILLKYTVFAFNVYLAPQCNQTHFAGKSYLQFRPKDFIFKMICRFNVSGILSMNRDWSKLSFYSFSQYCTFVNIDSCHQYGILGAILQVSFL